MHGSEGRDELPRAYSLALRLRDLGLDDTQIAERLDIVAEAVQPLLRVAELKLQRLASTLEPAEDRAQGEGVPIVPRDAGSNPPRDLSPPSENGSDCEGRAGVGGSQ